MHTYNHIIHTEDIIQSQLIQQKMLKKKSQRKNVANKMVENGSNQFSLNIQSKDSKFRVHTPNLQQQKGFYFIKQSLNMLGPENFSYLLNHDDNLGNETFSKKKQIKMDEEFKIQKQSSVLALQTSQNSNYQGNIGSQPNILFNEQSNNSTQFFQGQRNIPSIIEIGQNENEIIFEKLATVKNSQNQNLKAPNQAAIFTQNASQSKEEQVVTQAEIKKDLNKILDQQEQPKEINSSQNQNIVKEVVEEQQNTINLTNISNQLDNLINKDIFQFSKGLLAKNQPDDKNHQEITKIDEEQEGNSENAIPQIVEDHMDNLSGVKTQGQSKAHKNTVNDQISKLNLFKMDIEKEKPVDTSKNTNSIQMKQNIIQEHLENLSQQKNNIQNDIMNNESKVKENINIQQEQFQILQTSDSQPKQIQETVPQNLLISLQKEKTTPPKLEKTSSIEKGKKRKQDIEIKLSLISNNSKQKLQNPNKNGTNNGQDQLKQGLFEPKTTSEVQPISKEEMLKSQLQNPDFQFQQGKETPQCNTKLNYTGSVEKNQKLIKEITQKLFTQFKSKQEQNKSSNDQNLNIQNGQLHNDGITQITTESQLIPNQQQIQKVYPEIQTKISFDSEVNKQLVPQQVAMDNQSEIQESVIQIESQKDKGIDQQINKKLNIIPQIEKVQELEEAKSVVEIEKQKIQEIGKENIQDVCKDQINQNLEILKEDKVNNPQIAQESKLQNKVLESKMEIETPPKQVTSPIIPQTENKAIQFSLPSSIILTKPVESKEIEIKQFLKDNNQPKNDQITKVVTQEKEEKVLIPKDSVHQTQKTSGKMEIETPQKQVNDNKMEIEEPEPQPENKVTDKIPSENGQQEFVILREEISQKSCEEEKIEQQHGNLNAPFEKVNDQQQKPVEKVSTDNSQNQNLDNKLQITIQEENQSSQKVEVETNQKEQEFSTNPKENQTKEQLTEQKNNPTIGQEIQSLTKQTEQHQKEFIKDGTTIQNGVAKTNKNPLVEEKLSTEEKKNKTFKLLDQSPIIEKEEHFYSNEQQKEFLKELTESQKVASKAQFLSHQQKILTAAEENPITTQEKPDIHQKEFIKEIQILKSDLNLQEPSLKQSSLQNQEQHQSPFLNLLKPSSSEKKGIILDQPNPKGNIPLKSAPVIKITPEKIIQPDDEASKDIQIQVKSSKEKFCNPKLSIKEKMLKSQGSSRLLPDVNGEIPVKEKNITNQDKKQTFSMDIEQPSNEIPKTQKSLKDELEQIDNSLELYEKQNWEKTKKDSNENSKDNKVQIFPEIQCSPQMVKTSLDKEQLTNSQEKNKEQLNDSHENLNIGQIFPSQGSSMVKSSEKNNSNMQIIRNLNTKTQESFLIVPNNTKQQPFSEVEEEVKKDSNLFQQAESQTKTITMNQFGQIDNKEQKPNNGEVIKDVKNTGMELEEFNKESHQKLFKLSCSAQKELSSTAQKAKHEASEMQDDLSLFGNQKQENQQQKILSEEVDPIQNEQDTQQQILQEEIEPIQIESQQQPEPKTQDIVILSEYNEQSKQFPPSSNLDIQQQILQEEDKIENEPIKPQLKNSNVKESITNKNQPLHQIDQPSQPNQICNQPPNQIWKEQTEQEQKSEQNQEILPLKSEQNKRESQNIPNLLFMKSEGNNKDNQKVPNLLDLKSENNQNILSTKTEQIIIKQASDTSMKEIKDDDDDNENEIPLILQEDKTDQRNQITQTTKIQKQQQSTMTTSLKKLLIQHHTQTEIKVIQKKEKASQVDSTLNSQESKKSQTRKIKKSRIEQLFSKPKITKDDLSYGLQSLLQKLQYSTLNERSKVQYKKIFFDLLGEELPKRTNERGDNMQKFMSAAKSIAQDSSNYEVYEFLAKTLMEIFKISGQQSSQISQDLSQTQNSLPKLDKSQQIRKKQQKRQKSKSKSKSQDRFQRVTRSIAKKKQVERNYFPFT